jgi:PAP2 superfamily
MSVDTQDHTPEDVLPRGGRFAGLFRPWTWSLSRLGLAAYLLVLGTYIVRVGVPIDRIGQSVWIVAGISAARLGRPVRDHVRAILDWLPLIAALILYDHTRGIADTLGIPTRVLELVDLERLIFGGTLPTAWLQEHFYDPGNPHWWDAAASLIYVSHFVLPWALAAVLYVRSRPIWLTYVRRVVLLSYAGLATYILIPAAPPWFASGYGYVPDQMDRIATGGWSVLGLRSAGVMLDQAQAGSNHVAALPSLHAAFAMLFSVTMWFLVRNRLVRVLVAIYPIAMGLTLVYGGEHYVVDVVLGWVYVGVVLLVSIAWETWRSSAADDTPDDVSSSVGVIGPDHDLTPVIVDGHGETDASTGKSRADGLEFGGSSGGSDGDQQPILGLRGSDQGGSARERPADDQQ